LQGAVLAGSLLVSSNACGMTSAIDDSAPQFRQEISSTATSVTAIPLAGYAAPGTIPLPGYTAPPGTINFPQVRAVPVPGVPLVQQDINMMSPSGVSQTIGR
jgi:hypothetical protein